MSSRQQPNRRQQRRPQRQQSATRWTWYAIGGAVGAVFIVVVVLFATGVFGGAGGNIDDDLTPGQVEDVVARAHVEGFAEAPVTLIEFGDFQCPFCRDYWSGSLDLVRNAYVGQGAVKIAFHQFAFLGEESRRAAEASECAADQDRFFEYHDVLYEQQGPENEGYLTTTRLLQFGNEVGLDMTAFEDCLLERRHQQAVLDDTAFARDLGVNSTPTVLLNGKRVSNPLNTSALINAIDAAQREGGAG